MTTNIYLEKIASKMDALKSTAKKFGRAFSGADVKESGDALKHMNMMGKKVPLGQKMEVQRMHAMDKKKMYVARGVAGGAAALGAGGAAAVAKKD